MTSKVYFISNNKINSDSIKSVISETKYFKELKGKRNVGVKVHFGEDGNRNYLDPEYVKNVVDIIKENKGNPTLIETSTLYRGARQNRSTHIKIAEKHGFGKDRIGAPIEIVDGERGEDFIEVKTNYQNVKSAKIAKGLNRFDGLINLAHFKGHFVVGFGGAIKNIAMGLAARGGKLEMHSHTKPSVKKAKCKKCEACLGVCPADAIVISEHGAVIGKSCIGCATCIEICPEDAIRINWNESSQVIQKKMAEYAKTILQDRFCLHFNYAIRVTPNCDCISIVEKPIMPDIGIFISYDPVACEQAAWDSTKNNIMKLYPKINPEILLEYSEKLGLGKRVHEIIEV